MAYLKIFPIKVTDKKALDYITNPDKTEEKLLVSSFGCSPETADHILVDKMYKETWFLTKNDAEAKLKELRGNQNGKV